MGIYNVAEYGTDVIYGDSPKLQYYAEPFNSTAISYTQVQLTWVQPAGDYSDIRVVRSNDGFPETAEDGAIIWSWNSLEGGTQITNFLDGNDPTKPLVSGKFVYYRIWVKVPTGAWKVVGDSYTLVPIQHATLAPDKTTLVDTKNKLLDIIPRVYTSAAQSPIDEVDPNSDLSTFLDAFAFEIDRSLTYADLLLPLESWRFVSPDILALQSLQLGLPLEPYLATKQQRRLAREANFIYENKGTLKGISTFVESLTGFAPLVSISPNLVLTPQDSTFTDGVGFWRPVGDVELTTVTTVPGVPPNIEPYVDDYRFVGKATVNEIGSRIVNGADRPITQGTPVDAGTAYTFSGYGKAADGQTMGVKGYALWYDINGNLFNIDPPRSFVQTPQEVTDEWTKFSFVGRSPGVARNIVAYSIDSGALTFYSDSPNVMVRGETIVVEGVSETIDGIYQIELVGITPETINQVIVATEEPDTDGSVICSGVFREADPDIETYPVAVPEIGAAAGDPVLRVVAAGQIVDGMASVTFAAPHGLVAGDKIVIQAMSTYFSFGVHTILTTPTDSSVTFQIYEPYTGIINTTLDEGPYAPGAGPGPLGSWGYAVKILPDTATIVPPAAYASFELEFADTGELYLDLLQMATYDVPLFHEARAVEIFLLPTKTNFLRNPGFNPAGALQWTIVGSDSAFVNRTDLDLVGAGYSLELDTYNPLAMAGYSISSGTATVQLTSAHDLITGNGVVIQPASYDYVIGAAVSSNVATLTFAAPHSYSIGTPILIVGNNAEFGTDFTGVAVVSATTINTVSFATMASDKVYELSATPYGAVAAYHPVYGSHTLTGVGAGTISFAVTSPDTPAPVSLLAPVGVISSISTISAPVRSGRFVTASIYAKTDEGTEALSLYLNAVDGANSQLVATATTSMAVTDKWTRFSATVFVPKVSPDTIVVSLAVGGIGSGGLVYFDHAQVEDSYTATDYFDGAMPSAVTYGAVWEDPTAAHNTPTHLYPNLPAKITRLKQELPKYIPINSSFLVQWYGGGIAKPIV